MSYPDLSSAVQAPVPGSILLTQCKGPRAGASFRCHAGAPVYIGRSPSRCNLPLPDYNTVSSQHCRIDITESGVSVTDLGSTNGTYLNHVRLTPNQPASLANGAELMLGSADCVIRVQFELPEPPPPQPEIPRQQEFPTLPGTTETPELPELPTLPGTPVQPPVSEPPAPPRKKKPWWILVLLLAAAIAAGAYFLLYCNHQWDIWSASGAQMTRTCQLCQKQQTADYDYEIMATDYIVGQWNGIGYGSTSSQGLFPAGTCYAEFLTDGTYSITLNDQTQTGTWELFSSDGDYTYALDLSGDSVSGVIDANLSTLTDEYRQQGIKTLTYYLGTKDNFRIVFGNFSVSD